MHNSLTIADLEQRWQYTLDCTGTAVKRHPKVYGRLKAMAGDIISRPLDVRDYLSTAETLVDLLTSLDPDGNGSIFHIFKDRFSPTTIWQAHWLRMECRDLLAHLEAFEEWRLHNHHLRVVR